MILDNPFSTGVKKSMIILALFQSQIFGRSGLRNCKISSTPTQFQAKLYLILCDAAGRKRFE